MVGLPRQTGGVQPPHGAPGGVASAGPNGAGPGGYMANPQQQQQAAMMKQMIAMEQEKRAQLHLMEQKAQLMREQRQQQQQQHMLAEQVIHRLHHSTLISIPCKRSTGEDFYYHILKRFNNRHEPSVKQQGQRTPHMIPT